ncbi:threonine/homoserine/homoserine lactone efflux protein [Rhodopseudomonas julia]|uniref:Threonine/homoserine/homoserine lactone efflux protein n=1 Tax=Rhodopseudomonas julia TaxID=200617 RepID=A0ABU0C552_9BRAD|nr:LysE family translocator [Rhodopseudomonas julia]MDQ0325648.1 threonine/homoserine/homoserine lactone efflux protein [Rhodopseudomonas julia]
MDFLPSLAVIATFTFAAGVLIITPGPDMTLFLSRTLTQGRAAGLAAMLGATSGLVVHTMLAAFGLSALLAASPKAFLAVKIVGALYLLFLAFQAIRRGSALTLDTTLRSRQPLMKSWLAGFGINLLNPKIVLFFVTFLPQFISVNDPHASAKLAFLGSYFICLGVPSCAAMVLAADRVSATLRRSRKISRAIDWLCASIFGAFAFRILLARGQ